MLNQKHILLGYSGHAYVVLEEARRAGINVVAYAEFEKASKNPYKLEYAGFEGSDTFNAWQKEYGFILGIGDNALRKKVAMKVLAKSEILDRVISPFSNISATATIGEGTFVNKGALINALAEIKEGCIINSGAIIEHECFIDAFTHIAPGAVLAGNVKVGKDVFIGANAVLREGIRIGDGALIGAGSVVIKNVEAHTTLVGNPAIPIK